MALVIGTRALDIRLALSKRLSGRHGLTYLENDNMNDSPIMQAVRVYIDDRRSAGGQAKSLVQVELQVVDNVGCAPMQWRADACELLEKIQQSLAPIEGK
jgi:hypothetical protein